MKRRLSPLPFVVAILLATASGCGGCGGGGANQGQPEPDAAFDSSGVLDVTMPMEAMTDAPASDGGGDGDGGLGMIPVSAGGTGAFGVVTVGGKQKLYLPTTRSNASGDSMIAVVDVGVPGNGIAGAPALITTIDLGQPFANTTAGDSSMVVAAATGSPDVWLIDPTTDTLVKHFTLDASFGQSSFSLGGGYVTGIAMDSANHRAILAVWNGFAVLDLQTQSITSVIQAPPSENFGFDSVHGLVYAPFYDCTYSINKSEGGSGVMPSACTTPRAPGDGGTVMTDGLSVIRLSDSTVFTYEDPNALDPTKPVGSEPDSAGADPMRQLVVVASEGSSYENVLDFSKASFDTASKRVTAPHEVVQNLPYMGIAVDPTSHVVFLEAEGSNMIAWMDLLSASQGDQGSVSGTMPDLPTSGTFANLGDPHGAAAATSIIGGKSVAFLADGRWQWVARIDLATLAALEQSDASVAATNAQIAAAVTYLDATTKE
ncbi:MAG TPA: hypothetical protein VMI75_16720 [Polyangiaceae bacterium]|nr:hypothetical protein [Polyangiaceae bacterium]